MYIRLANSDMSRFISPESPRMKSESYEFRINSDELRFELMGKISPRYWEYKELAKGIHVFYYPITKRKKIRKTLRQLAGLMEV